MSFMLSEATIAAGISWRYSSAWNDSVVGRFSASDFQQRSAIPKR